MNSKKLIVSIIAVVSLLAFLLGVYVYQQQVQTAHQEKVTQAIASTGSTAGSDSAADNRLVRFHSPVIGPTNAPVTIVEFFDPGCETCRAFHPIVKDILAQYPDQVRVVIRYAPFHAGADHVVKLLEASRRQNLYLPVLEAVLDAQPQWADHGKPNVELAFAAAKGAGLDLEKALRDAQRPDIAAVLRQDVEDLLALDVTKTPTFFVNGRALPSFGERQLRALVAEEVAKLK